MVILVLVVLGLVLGSFVNAFTWRLRHGKDWVNGRSECVRCHHVLSASDLIPVISWLWLRGKCRYCRKKIDDNPLVELALPVLFVFSYYFWPQAIAGGEVAIFGAWLVFLTGFLALAVYDIRWFELPDLIVFPLIALAVVTAAAKAWLVSDTSVFVSALSGAAVIGGLFFVLNKVSHERWIGGGDVTLGVALGLLAGGAANAFLLLFIASVTGLVSAIPMMVKGKARLDSHLPFGPFLIIGAVVVVLFGQGIINWYTGLFYA